MAIQFDAGGDYISRTANVPAQNTISISLWLYISVDRNARCVFIGVSDGAALANFVALDADGTTLALTRVGATDATGSNLSVGTWYHIGYTRNSSNVSTVYLNGAQDMQNTTANAFTSAIMLLGSDSINYLNGRLAYIKVWDEALTQADIQAEMYSAWPRHTDNLNLWTPNLIGSTERLRDYSGKGRNWTSNGTLADADGPPVTWAAPNYYLAPKIIPAVGGATTYQPVLRPWGIFG